MEAVVGLGQAFVVSDHEGGAELVARRAGGFEGGMGLPAVGERKRIETVGRGVAKVVFHCRSQKFRPYLMEARLQYGESGVRIQWKYDECVAKYHHRLYESECLHIGCLRNNKNFFRAGNGGV